MRRREFITLLGGAAAVLPLAARAQQPAFPVVGVLDNTATAPGGFGRAAAIRQGLAEAGFVEGRNVAIEFRDWGNRPDQLPALAADLVRRPVAAIIANAPAVAAVKSATSAIPVVFISGADPVESGLVASLNRPGGNMTGVSFTSAPLNPKRLELLHELVPAPAVIGGLWDPDILNPEASLRHLEGAARALGRQVMIVQARTETAIDEAFATFAQAGVGVLFVGTGTFYATQRRQVVALAARHKIPSSYAGREFVVLGGLMSYGASDRDAYRRAALQVGRILKGAKPGDLPVELPTKYELVFNLATARMLHLEISPRLRALADEVIE